MKYRMTSEGSQVDSDLNIYFVITRDQKDENDCSSDMWHAFNSCDEHELSPKWIKENLCDNLAPGKKDVFVLEEFEGSTFAHLKKFKCSRIVGPRCLLSCFMTGEPIPEGTSPVFTTAMRGLVVSVSGLTSEAKENIGRKVEYMGGVYSRQLRNSVTHLIANFVMSEKYEKAVEQKIPVMTENWVTAIWEASLVENIRATSSRFDEYKCPVFMNLVVTSTNLSKRKKEIKQLITDNGGIFMGALDGAKVKIVVAPEDSVLSEKLKYALQNNIACVTPQWVHHSVKHGYALPFSDYLVKTTKKCSTPEKSNVNATLNFSTISTIPGDSNQNGFVNETMMTTMSSTIQERSPLENRAAYVEVLARLNIHQAKMAGSFLDGCNIYLTGFPLDHREKLNRILNVGSATRLDDISDAVTHVIVGEPGKALPEIKSMKSMGLSPYFLTIDWLEESMKIKSTAAEEDFKYELSEDVSHEKKMEPPSPLSKKNLQLLQKPRKPPVPVFNIDKEMNQVKEPEEPDLIQEYLRSNASSVANKSLKELVQQQNESTLKSDKNSDAKTVTNGNCHTGEPHVSELSDDSTIPITQPSETNVRILEGLTFILTGFEDQEETELSSSITTLGGKVVPNSYKGIPDYGVVPLFGAPLKHTVNEIVTDLFIEDCIDLEAVVEIKYYYKPISLSKDVTPLTNCVIAMSSYTGKERTFLSNVAEALGARYQDTFARKTYLNRNTYGCTHLVCPTPEGSKYNAAVKWKLPAVTADWLLACLAQERWVDETPYLVGETIIADDRPEDPKTGTPNQIDPVIGEMGPPSNPNIRQIITPKRNLPSLQSSCSSSEMTPINKRLSLGDYKTPPSPFHVSTPDTPYGQCFKPNPSPATRKRWLKWAEDLPDMFVPEPPLKRRRPSTPLSELKKQLWEELKKPFVRQEDQNPAADQDEAANVSEDVPDAVEGNHASNSPLSTNTPIKKVLAFDDENSPTKTDQINLQLAQLDQVLQASTPESRPSSSSDSAKQPIYDSEPVDHITKCPVKDSQPDTVGWEAPVHTVLRRKSTIPEDVEHEDVENAPDTTVLTDVGKEIRSKPKFMLSGIKDRGDYEKVIVELGGDFSKEPNYDMSATHLLCMKPARNEKLLASIAAGKWVLHCYYLRDSEEAGMFLDEEKYEWGNPKSENIIPNPTTDTESQIAAAAHRWRLKLTTNPGGAFRDMVALLIGPKERCQQFQRLICAGGGTVVEARPPYNTSPKSKKVTHCFIQVKQIDQPVDWAMMASKGILCFLPQYLSDHLTAEKQLNPKDCVLPEFRKYLSLLPK
ncbi:DNA topoisomerase 2-binding protein 1 isoform X1 [Neodiprion pinetum]|uniref:DNA topoisomerase 2-binding protein 1 isoform X1 n=2 Tax=Neodiprion pinetum TaxID=441929 RepID=UPI001EE132F1|nr:DNA topoisomerase 2-binding protein 1-A isoform X1 [Neodiprion pinetum]